MNKKSLVLALAVAGALTSVNALANPATVSFDGTVTEPTCTLTADSMARTVVMNDVTTASILAAEFVGGSDANAENINGAEVLVPPISFTGCPESATKIAIASMTGSGTHGTTGWYWTPEMGTGKGVRLGIGAQQTGTNNWWLCGLNETHTSPCTESTFTYYTVTSGSATTGSSLKVFAYPGSGWQDPANVIPGTYATTFTFTFEWL